MNAQWQVAKIITIEVSEQSEFSTNKNLCWSVCEKAVGMVLGCIMAYVLWDCATMVLTGLLYVKLFKRQMAYSKYLQKEGTED